MADKVIDNLYLGDRYDALDFRGVRLCVLEGWRGYGNEDNAVDSPSFNIPILVPSRKGFLLPYWASRERLDKAASFISDVVEKGCKLLVHCAAGIERSPLTVAWYLTRSKRYPSIDDAYSHLMAVRPEVEDRLFWLEPTGAVIARNRVVQAARRRNSMPSWL